MEKSQLKKFFETNSVPLNVIKYVFNEYEIAPNNVTKFEWSGFFSKLINANIDFKNEFVSKLLYLSYINNGTSFYFTEIKKFLKNEEEDYSHVLDILVKFNTDFIDIVNEFIVKLSVKNQRLSYIIKYLYKKDKNLLFNVIKFNISDNEKCLTIIKMINDIDSVFSNELNEKYLILTGKKIDVNQNNEAQKEQILKAANDLNYLYTLLENDYDYFVKNFPDKEYNSVIINDICKFDKKKSFGFLSLLTEKNINKTTIEYVYSKILSENNERMIKFAEENYYSPFKAKKEIAIRLLLEINKAEYELIFKNLLVTEKNNNLLFSLVESYFTVKEIADKYKISQKTAAFLSVFLKESINHKEKYKIIDLSSIHKLCWIHNNKEFTDKEIDLMLNYIEDNNKGVKNLKLLTTRESQIEFAKDIYSNWNRETKYVWILKVISYFGDDSIVEPFKNEIITLAENKRGAVAGTMVLYLALMNTRKSLQVINYLLHKVKHKQIKAAAEQALKDAAIELNLTKEDMLDKLIEDFGFNSDGIIELNYGTRKFFVSINIDYELLIKDENGKEIKSLPKANANENVETYHGMSLRFKEIKKTLKDEIKVQIERLEDNFWQKRFWSVENWKDIFINNPIMRKFAVTLIWGIYENDKPINTFRYNEDGTYSDANDDTKITINEVGSLTSEMYSDIIVDAVCFNENSLISLIHPIELNKEDVEKWKTIMSDYEIKQPFKQLERQIYISKNIEEKSIDIFKDKKVSSLTLRNKLTKVGFTFGNVDYSGEFYFYAKDLPESDITIIVTFSGDNTKNFATAIDCSLERIKFYKTSSLKDSYGTYKLLQDQIIPMKKISPLIYSEICDLLSGILI